MIREKAFAAPSGWLAIAILLAAFALGAAMLAGGRSVPGLLASAAAVPLASLRGLPWLGRSRGSGSRMPPPGGSNRCWPACSRRILPSTWRLSC